MLARRLLPGARRRSLGALAHFFGIPVAVRHRALPDARTAARILVRLLELAEERGAATEEDLAAICDGAGTPTPVRP